MPVFYQEQRLRLGRLSQSVDLMALARLETGPFYVYDLANLEFRVAQLQNALRPLSSVGLHYAMKANSHPEILRQLAGAGLGVDTVSGGEIARALECGFAPEKIIFSGVAKTRAELSLAIGKGIKQINVESPAELLRIAQVARDLHKPIDVAFRMNPDVNPQTHPYITTGFRDNKFGMDESFLPELKSILNANKGMIRLRGLTLHIGSQLMELSALREAIEKTILVYKQVQSDGFALDRLDVGGGLGIDYATDDESRELDLMREYGKMVEQLCLPLNCEVLLEPGRCLVARCGFLIAQVQYIKSSPYRNFVIVDTGMHHLLRPALYGAQHRILLLQVHDVEEVPAKTYDVVGPICESSDVLSKNIQLSVLADDYLALTDVGAYGFSMASRYNLHALPAQYGFRNGFRVF